MFGDDFLATLSTKLGFRADSASSTPAVVNSKNEMVPKTTTKASITPTPPAPNDLVSKIAKAAGLQNAPVPAPLKPVPAPSAEDVAKAKDSLRQTAQDFPRSVVRFTGSAGAGSIDLLNSISKAFGNVSPYPDMPKEISMPQDAVSRFFVGSEPIKTYQTEFKEQTEKAKSQNLPNYLTTPLAVLSTVGEIAGDLLGFLPEGEARNLLGKESKALITGITAETDAASIASKLKGSNISPDIAEKYSQQLAGTTTEKETAKVMKEVAAEQIQKTTEDAAGRLAQLKEEGQTRILTADELNEQDFLKKNANKPAELFLGYRTKESADAMKTEQGFPTDAMKPESPETVAAANHTIERNDLGEVSKVTDSEGKTIYDASAKEAEPVFGAADDLPATPKKISAYDNFRNKVSNKWTKIVENFQNNKNRIEKLVNSPEAKVTEASDPALAHTLYSGRLDTRMRAVQDELKATVTDTVKAAKDSKVSYQSFKDDVNDYLHSQHAPERNAQLGEGAAGITDEEAAKMQADLQAKPHFAQIKELSDKLLEMNKKTLDTLYAGGAAHGVIDKETYDLLRNTYKNHVPLNRIFEGEQNIGDVLTGKGFDVRGSGLKRAKGSAREVADIYTNVTSSLASAVQRVEKNLVDNATYEFIKANEDMGFGHVLNRPPSSSADPSVLQLRVHGKDKYVKFADQALADQFKAVGNERLPTLLKWVESFTRFYSGVATRFNPEFVLSNKFRDLQEAMVYAGSEGKLNAGSSVKVLAREAKLQNEKAILDHMRGIDSEGARAYQEMLDNGGATGGMALSTRKQIETTLEDIEKLAQSRPRQAMQATLGKIDQANEIFENSTRLSIYREARAQGLSEKAAASLAKESTVNFNRKGKWGSVINSLYMFSNASLQGSAKMIKAMRNPKVLAATATTVGTAVFLSNKHNDSVDPDWRDKVNKFDRASNMVIVLQGGDGKKFKYLTVPVSYALKPFKVAFDGAYDLASGTKDTSAKNVLESTVASVINGYNPVGGTDLGSALTPTFADVPREIGVNKKWTGSKIRPDADADLPDSRQYFDSLKDTPLGRMSIALTKTLSDHHIAEWSPANMAYAIEQYAGGTGAFGGKVYNTVINSVEGKPTPPSDVPFVSRFYKSVDGNELESRQDQASGDSATIKDIRSEGAKESFDKKQDLKSVIQNIKNGKTPQERKKTFNDFISAHPDQAKDLISEAQKEGKSFKQTQIESLQIKNGERAKFIFEKMNSIKDKEKKKKFFDELVTSGVLTPEVIKQIGSLKK